MKNSYILKVYSKEKKVVACKVCNSQKKVKNELLKNYVCCDNDFKFEKDYDIYRKRAVEKGLAFELTMYEFEHLVTSNCVYCKIGPREMADKVIRNGIDRIDNKLGYTRENTICACTSCNYMKRTHSLSGFRERADNISNTLREMSEITDEISKCSVLYNAGHTNIDLKMCLVLHAKKLIKLDKETIEKYVSSIHDPNHLRNSIADFGKYINRGMHTKGLEIKDLRSALCILVQICAEIVDEGGLKILTNVDDFVRTEKTKQVMVDVVPLTRKY